MPRNHVGFILQPDHYTTFTWIDLLPTAEARLTFGKPNPNVAPRSILPPKVGWPVRYCWEITKVWWGNGKSRPTHSPKSPDPIRWPTWIASNSKVRAMRVPNECLRPSPYHTGRPYQQPNNNHNNHTNATYDNNDNAWSHKTIFYLHLHWFLCLLYRYVCVCVLISFILGIKKLSRKYISHCFARTIGFCFLHETRVHLAIWEGFYITERIM